MRRIFLFTLILSSFTAFSQSPVTWNFTAKKLSATSYEIHMTANIDHGWSTYSQTTPEGGPLPTAISFNKNPLILLDGKVQEVGNMKKKHEEVFGVDVHYYKDKVDFVQVVKLKSKAKTSINGKIDFMVCDETRCLPPTGVPFTIKLQ